MKNPEKVQRACPICSSQDQTQVFAEENFDPSRLDEFAFSSRKIPEHMHYRLIICPSCDVLYASPLPTLDHIAESYHEAAYDSSEEAHYAARTYASFLKSIQVEKESALDIGTGDGAFLEELLKNGFKKVEGVEPSQSPIQAARADIKPLIRSGLFAAKDYAPASLNLVTCFQTFEHLYDPMKVAHEAQGILREGGAFFIVCHNRKGLSARILGMKSPIFDIEHLQLFSPKSAREMMKLAGFERVAVKTVYNVYPLHYWLKLLPFPKGLKIGLIRFLKAIQLGYLPVLMPAGNMAVIGYKPEA